MWQISRDTAEENDIPVFRTEEYMQPISVLKQKDERTFFNYNEVHVRRDSGDEWEFQ